LIARWWEYPLSLLVLKLFSCLITTGIKKNIVWVDTQWFTLFSCPSFIPVLEHFTCIYNYCFHFATTFFRIVIPKTVMWCIMHNSHIGIWHWICLSHMYHHVRILSNMDIVFLYLMATWLHSAYLLLEDIWSGSHSA
jgi:hypothetical protein